MKRFRTSLSAAALSLVMVAVACATCDAFDYLGDYCFPYTCTGGVSGTLKLGLFDLGELINFRDMSVGQLLYPVRGVVHLVFGNN